MTVLVFGANFTEKTTSRCRHGKLKITIAKCKWGEGKVKRGKENVRKGEKRRKEGMKEVGKKKEPKTLLKKFFRDKPLIFRVV